MEDPLKIYNDVLEITGESKANEGEEYGYWNHINAPSLSSSSFNRFLKEIGEYDRWSTMPENEKIYIVQFSDKVDDGLASISDYKPYSYEAYANEDDLLRLRIRDELRRMEREDNEKGIFWSYEPYSYWGNESYAGEGLYEDYIQMFPEDEWRTGGGFGHALKENDLVKAYQRADLGNRERLEKITGKSRYELERIAYESYANEDAINPDAELDIMSTPWDEQQGRFRNERDEQSPLDNIYSESVANEVPFSSGPFTWTCPSCSQQIEYETDTSFHKNIFDHLKSHGYSNEKVLAIYNADMKHTTQMEWIIHDI